MMKNTIATAHNNLRVEAIMRFASSMVNGMEDGLKNMQSLRLGRCPQFCIASPVGTNRMEQFNNVGDHIEMIPKSAQPLARPAGVDVALARVNTRQTNIAAQRVSSIEANAKNQSDDCGATRRSVRNLVATQAPGTGKDDSGEPSEQDDGDTDKSQGKKIHRKNPDDDPSDGDSGEPSSSPSRGDEEDGKRKKKQNKKKSLSNDR